MASPRRLTTRGRRRDGFTDTRAAQVLPKAPLNDEDQWHLVFDTASKGLYVEYRWIHVDVRGPDVAESGIAQLDIAEYLNQGGQTAGHRELWRLLKALFHEQAEAQPS